MAESATVTNIADFKKPESMWRQNIFLSLIAILAIALGALSYYWFGYSRFNISTDDAFIESELSPVNSRIMGFVKEVRVSENERVEKGQILATFDDTDLQVELGFKKAKLQKALADLKRAKSLLRSKALSMSDFELARTNSQAMQADFDGTMLKLKYTRILSPTDGFVGKKNMQPGQFIQPGQNLFAIVPTTLMWVRANYKETQLENVRPGMGVKITVDAFPGHTLVGRIESISPTSGAKLSILPPENATGNFTKIVQRVGVKIKLDFIPKDITLRPGMSATTTILTKAEKTGWP